MMFFIILSGAATIPLLNMEVFPDIEVDIINVTAIYPGATPSDVENAVCVRIEERLQGLDGVKKISSTASENVGSVNVEILSGQDVTEMLDRVKAEVDAIDNFPEGVERPTTKQFITSQANITVAVGGEMDELTLTNLTEEVKDEIDALPGVTYSSFVAKKDKEISIEISEKTLRKYDLTLSQISRAIQSLSIDIPSGSIENINGEILIRAQGQGYTVDYFSSIPIISDPSGSIVRLGEISELNDAFSIDYDLEFLFNSQPSNLITVYRVGDQNSIDISSQIKDYVEKKQKILPEGIHITAFDDEARLLVGRIETMTKNAYQGLLLVVIVLALFLKPKLAFWVSLGIPISFMGGFWFMPALDLSINMLSLFTFILVLGIVVDDAIVVGENIALFRERGMDPKEAAVKAATQVSIPVFFAVLTTMATFSPMLAVEGQIGAIWRIFPLITISVLFWSLFESLTILPAHLAHSSEKKSKIIWIRSLSDRWEKFQSKIKNGLVFFVNTYYKPTLLKSVNRPFTFLSIAASVFILTIGIIGGGIIKFSFFPPIEADLAIGTVEYPSGTSIEITREGYLKLEESAKILEEELNKEFPGKSIIKNRLSTIGFQPQRTKTSRGPGNLNASYGGPHLAEVALELIPGEERSIGTEEIVRRWRRLMPSVPGVKDVGFFSSLFSTGEPVNVQLSSKYMDDLLDAKEELKRELIQFPGVFDVKDNFNIGKEEISIKLLPAAENYGINMMMLGSQVQQAFYGLEVQSIQRGRDEVKVMLRYPKNERASISNLEDMMIKVPNGSTIPVRQIAKLELGEGLSSIQRKNRKRAINVTADVDLTVTTGNEVIAAVTASILPKILKKYNSISISLEGEQQEQGQNLKSIGKNFLLAMVVVYMLLAIPFKSYFQPLVVMSSIPFGLTGAVFGHLIMGINFSVLSMMGFVALTGVVVNDSLVMVDFINRYRSEGNSIMDAVLEAGPRRFRPIFLTSLTTFVGLTPLLLEKSIQAKFMIPMAVSLSFGVIFATAITLFLVPVGYLVLEKYILKTEKVKINET
jgi:multidrug efflux pump subunit AcrB